LRETSNVAKTYCDEDNQLTSALAKACAPALEQVRTVKDTLSRYAQRNRVWCGYNATRVPSSQTM